MVVATKSIKFIAVLFLTLTSFMAYAGEGEKHGGNVDTKEEIEDYIEHHLADAHDFHLYSYTAENGEKTHQLSSTSYCLD